MGFKAILVSLAVCALFFTVSPAEQKTRYFCDRCHKEMSQVQDIPLTYMSPISAGQFDLCPDCYSKFKKWIGKSENMAELYHLLMLTGK